MPTIFFCFTIWFVQKKIFRIKNSTYYNNGIRDTSKVRKLSEFKAYITWRKIVRKTFLNFYKCWNI